MHGHRTERLPTIDLVATRIADLSEEYIYADDARRDAIGAEIAGLMSGRIKPLPTRH